MKIQLKRSNVLDSGSAKEPTAAQMEYGELAVNYNTNDPSLFIKDSSDNIVKIGGLTPDYDTRYLRIDAAAGDQTVESTIGTKFSSNVFVGDHTVDYSNWNNEPGLPRVGSSGGFVTTGDFGFTVNESMTTTNTNPVGFTSFPTGKSDVALTYRAFSSNALGSGAVTNLNLSSYINFTARAGQNNNQKQIYPSAQFIGFESNIKKGIVGGGTGSFGSHFNFLATQDAPSFFTGNTHIGGTTARNTRELWESTLTEEQTERLAAGTLVVPANVSIPGDGEFARQWWYDRQSAEDQALIDSGELDYPEHLQAANFVDTFDLGDNTAIDLLSGGHIKASSIGKTGNFKVEAEGTGKLILRGGEGTQVSGTATTTPLQISTNNAPPFTVSSDTGRKTRNHFYSYGRVLNAVDGDESTELEDFNICLSAFWNGGSTVNNPKIQEKRGYTAESSIGRVTWDVPSEHRNIGFYSNLLPDPDSKAFNYNFYAARTAPNWFKGDVRGGGDTGEAPNWTIKSNGTAIGITVTRAAVVTDEQAGTTETLLDIITDLRARIAALEAG